MEYFDLFGSIVGITYNGHMRYRSKFGGVCFLTVMLICLAVILFYFNKFVSKEDPKMVLEEEKFWNPPQIDLTDFKFIIMMKFAGENNFINNAIQIKPMLIKVDQKAGSIKEIELTKVPCNEAMFPGGKDEYDILQLSKGICIDTSGISILGSSVNEVFQYITIRFSLCLKGDSCLDSESLEQFIGIQKPIALVYIYDSAFQPYNSNQFVKKFFNSFEVVVTFNDAKYSDIYLSNNQLTIAEGIFIDKSQKVLSSVMFDSFRDSVSVRTADQEIALDINFMSSKRKQVTNITYMQLSELLANIGAITSNIIFIFNFFVGRVNQTLYEKELIHEVFKIKLNPCSAVNTTVFKKNSKHLSITTYSNISVVQNNDKLTVANYLTNMTGTKGKFNNKMILFYSICGNFCWKNDTRLKTFQILREKLKEKQDFKNLILSFQDIELLKHLTLTEQQLKLFDLIKKPLVLFDDNKIEHVNDYSLRCFNTKLDKIDVKCLEGCLDKLKAKTIKDSVDNKILNLFKV
jgi:hypothetical protein